MANILIVEDDKVQVKIIEMFMKQLNHNGIICQNADDFIDIAIRYKPAVIILDVMLPTQSGLELLRDAKQFAELANIPTIIMTADMDARTRHVASMSGADFFTEKPITFEEFTMLIDSALALNHQQK